MGTFNLVNRIDVKSKNGNIDYLYGPYQSLSEAFEAVPKSRRSKGRTVGIIQDNKVVEYWWNGGIEDSDIKEKITAEVDYVEQEIKFCDESTYNDLVEHGLVNPDVIYFVYEDEDEEEEQNVIQG